MSDENRSNWVAVIGGIAGLGLLAVGGVSLAIGLGAVHNDAISVLAAAACFAVSTAAFGLLFSSVLRR